METPPIEVLRVAFAQSAIATLATQVSCYLRLVTHPDVQYFDLLDALSRNAVIGDDAARRLHRRLEHAASSSPPVVRRVFWEEELRIRGIDPATPFHAALPPAQGSPSPGPAEPKPV